VTLEAPRIEISDGGEASARSTPGYQGIGFANLGRFVAPEPRARGDAGTVTLVAERLLLRDGGTIATDAEAADGGNIEIEAKHLVHLDAGEITAAVNGGSGGNITIDPDVVILENGSQIVANAGEGSGGNIQITADNYFAFPGSLVDASSDLGIDGMVEVHTPDVDLAGKITTLPTNFLDASSLMRERCAARRSGERAGSFSVRGNGGIPAEPDGWLPASVAFEIAPAPLGVASEAPTVTIAPASPGASWRLARSRCR